MPVEEKSGSGAGLRIGGGEQEPGRRICEGGGGAEGPVADSAMAAADGGEESHGYGSVRERVKWKGLWWIRR
jgi:hypothetical protein